MKIFPTKNQADSWSVEFDFSDKIYISDIESASITVDYFSGVGNNPAGEILSGNPVITDLVVKQKLKDGVPYTTYKLRCTAFLTNGDRVSQEGVISIDGYTSLGATTVTST